MYFSYSQSVSLSVVCVVYLYLRQRWHVCVVYYPLTGCDWQQTSASCMLIRTDLTSEMQWRWRVGHGRAEGVFIKRELVSWTCVLRLVWVRLVHTTFAVSMCFNSCYVEIVGCAIDMTGCNKSKVCDDCVHQFRLGMQEVWRHLQKPTVLVWQWRSRQN